MKVNNMQETNWEHVHTDTPQEAKKKKKREMIKLVKVGNLHSQCKFFIV